MNFIKSVIFEGKIPYFHIINKYLYLLALCALLIFIVPSEFVGFGEAAWKILMIIMFLKPASVLLPKLGILRRGLAIRKHLGIICGAFAIAHGVGFAITNFPNGPDMIRESIGKTDSYIFWGTIALLSTIPPLLTSNNFSLRLFKKHWKKLQYPAYAMFFFTILHIYFIEKEIGILLVLIFWIILKIMEKKKIVLWK